MRHTCSVHIMKIIFTRPLIRLAIFLLLMVKTSLAFSQPVIQWHDVAKELEIQHEDKSGLYILEKGEEALISRAWLVDNAKHSIDVQYFIWSTDNIGTLAAAALLRAANRGVQVRVIIDDLLIDADNEALFALAIHPKIEIKIYNPNINVGTSLLGKIFNTTVNFRGINQRMHNKVIIVDRRVFITGGRNMADEYYDFDHEYNFRDRDVLVLGEAAKAADTSFSDFWRSDFVVPIEKLISNPYENEVDIVSVDDWGDEYEIDENVVKHQVNEITKKNVSAVYQYLETYEADNSNFAPEMRVKIKDINHQFNMIVEQVRWVKADFISDLPGKNNRLFTLGGGSKITSALVSYVESAKESITIQTPYLIMSYEAWKLFRNAVKRGVKVRIVTNSLSSTDNLLAYSGYARQRNRLLNSGIEIYEFKPDAKIREDIINRYKELKGKPPIFAIHAKSMVVDGKKAFIGSFNFDPRSENLNTEAGISFEDSKLAQEIEVAIENDMLPENSWNVKREGHSHDTSIIKRTKVFFLKLIPMDDIL